METQEEGVTEEVKGGTEIHFGNTTAEGNERLVLLTDKKRLNLDLTSIFVDKL